MRKRSPWPAKFRSWLEIRDLDPGDDAKLRRRQKRGRKAYERFFTANIRMVISIARRYTTIARELTIDDLTMEGMIGLSRAIELFDPTRGYKFSTYAFNWIRQSISRSVSHFDRSIRLPVNGIERLSKLGKWLPVFKAEQRAFSNSGRRWLSTPNARCRPLRHTCSTRSG